MVFVKKLRNKAKVKSKKAKERRNKKGLKPKAYANKDATRFFL
jgi:hypothetical protein